MSKGPSAFLNAFLFSFSAQLQRRALDGRAPLLDLRGRRLLLRRYLRCLRVHPTEAARPQDVQAHPEADDVRRLTILYRVVHVAVE